MYNLIRYVYSSLFIDIKCVFLVCSLIFMLWNTGSLVVNYPYDDDKEERKQYSACPDDEVFKQVSLAYSQVTGHGGYWICFMLR